MGTRSRRHLRFLSVLVAAGLLPGACGPDGAGEGPGGTPGSTGSSAPPEASSAAGDGDGAEERAAGGAEVGAGDGAEVVAGTVVDDEGAPIPLEDRPERIVSLVPSATEVLLALGSGDRLVGRTDFDTLAAVSDLPSVGGGLRPSLEHLVSLDPDLVIRFAGPSDRATPRRLDDLGVRHLAIRPDGIDDVRRIVRILGRVTGRTNRGDSLVASMDSALAAIRERVASRDEPSVAYVLQGSPPWVAGPGSFVDQLIGVAGGRNAFADLERLYGPVSEEIFVDRSIDLVLTASPAELLFVPEDVPVERVPATVETPGLDLAESAELLARRIHPGAFR